MSDILLVVVSVLYVGAFIGFLYNHKYGMALAFFAYAVSNVGFVMANRGI